MSRERPRIGDTRAAKECRASFRYGYELGTIGVACWLRRLGFVDVYEAILAGDFEHYQETKELRPLPSVGKRRKRAQEQMELTGGHNGRR